MPAAEQVDPRRRQLAARLAWPACGLTLALLVGGLLLPADTPAGVVGLAPIALWAAANAVVGGLIAARRPQHPIGWLLLASGLLVSLAQFAGQYAYYTLVTRPGSLPWGQAMLWLAGWPNNAGFVLVVFLLLLFPTGRLLSPRWRPVARFATAVYVINVVGLAFAPGPSTRTGLVRCLTRWGSRRSSTSPQQPKRLGPGSGWWPRWPRWPRCCCGYGGLGEWNVNSSSGSAMPLRCSPSPSWSRSRSRPWAATTSTG